MRVAVIIVNYRTAGLAQACLKSLHDDDWIPSHGRVIVVDNDSGDDSCEEIRQAISQNHWGDWAEVVAAERNGGFAYGNNIGIRWVLRAPDKPQYILLLNPDTVVRPRAIETLVRFAEEHPERGVCGGRLLDAEGRPQCSGFRFPSALGELESGARLGILTRLLGRRVAPMPLSDVPMRVDWVSGACFLARREMLEQVGVLDDRFFMYYEEVDYCRRAKAAGWEVWYAPQAEVVHLEGAASGISQPRMPRPRYWYESRRRYFAKHHGRVSAAVAELLFQAGYLTWRLRRPLQGKADLDPQRRVSDGWRHVIIPTLSGR